MNTEKEINNLRSYASWREIDLYKYQQIGVLEKTAYDRDYAAYELFRSVHSNEWKRGRRFFVRYSFLYLEQLCELIQQRIVQCSQYSLFERECRQLALYAILDHVFGLLHAERVELSPILSIFQIKEDCLRFLDMENILDFIWCQQIQSNWFPKKYIQDVHQRWKMKKEPIINQWMKEQEIDQIPISYAQFCLVKREMWGVCPHPIEQMISNWILSECEWMEAFLED